MKIRTAALIAGLLSAGFAAEASATETVVIDRDADAVVRVVNLNKNNVRVYVFDKEGRRSLLGEVRAGDFAELAIEATLLAQGPVQVKAYPMDRIGGLGHPSAGDHGVRSNKLHLGAGDVIDFWLEPNLESSMLRITRG